MIALDASNHTGKELELMLAQRKPLAMFYAEVGELPNEELIPEMAFEPHVKAGRFSRTEMTLEDRELHPKLGRAPHWSYVIFAVPDEEWRVRIMQTLLRARHNGGGWNETCERIECTLLGYTGAETDAWCTHVFSAAT
jgi:hypothetical protein